MDMSLTKFHQEVHKLNRMTEDIVGAVAICILNALAYLKSKSIIHRDVKPYNILLNKTGEIKLADFGLSRIHSIASSAHLGTLLYMPPEIVLDGYQTRSSMDIWSFGITLVELATGRPVFDTDNPLQIIDLIRNPNIDNIIGSSDVGRISERRV